MGRAPASVGELLTLTPCQSPTQKLTSSLEQRQLVLVCLLTCLRCLRAGWFVCETGSHYIHQAGLKLRGLPALPPQCAPTPGYES